MTNLVYQSSIPELELISKGKVREIYNYGENLLFFTSDRISAFDVIINEAVAEKGKLLNSISKFWFDKSKTIIDNHFIHSDFNKLTDLQNHQSQLDGRFMIVKKTKPLPVEFVVRGYLAGSGWKEYQNNGKVCGVELPEGLKNYSKLPEPIFTPATKADEGHDENIDFDRAAEILGLEKAQKLKEISIKLYKFGHDYLAERGIVLADTKFEFGELPDGEIILIDEALTPDSSRFWDANGWVEGTTPNNFDKQTLRDYLETLDWDKEPPAPAIPTQILSKISDQYHDIFKRITS